MSQTITNEAVMVEYINDHIRVTNEAVMVEYQEIDGGALKINMDAQMNKSMRGGMNG